MTTLLPKNDLELHRAFEIILSIESFSNHINEISELIYNDELDNETIEIVLKRNGFGKLEEIKEELLDLLLVYINLILNDHIISENERKNLKILKMYFKVSEGDFIKYRKPEVEYVLQRQFERIYMDNEVDLRESIHKVNLQEIFDLSYDQFEKFKETEVIRALERGADISKL